MSPRRLAASAFLHLLVLGRLGFDGDQLPGVIAGSLVFSIPFIALFVAYFALLPAVVVLGITEILGRRDWLTYALGGGAVGIAVAAVFWQAGRVPGTPDPADFGFQQQIDPALASPAFLGLLVGGGVVGGLAYWLVAGRLAGGWRRDPR